MKIIGITSHIGNNHDSSAALIEDGKVKFAESVERVTRKKHDKSFADPVIKDILHQESIRKSDIDYFASGAPNATSFVKIKSYIDGLRFVSTGDLFSWIILNCLYVVRSLPSIFSKLTSYEKSGYPMKKLLFIPHHLAHAETAYSFSGMDKCLVVAWDGYGPDHSGYPWCAGIYIGEGGKLRLLEQINVWNSIGLYYGAVTIALGFKLNDGEGKTMGFASYGKASGAINSMRKFFPSFSNGNWKTRSNWMEIAGVSRLSYFKTTHSYKELNQMIEKYGREQVAFAAQVVFEEVCEDYFKYIVTKYGIRDVAVAGGIFLNVKFNMRILKNKIVDALFIYPNPGDGGVAVGAAIAAYKKLGKRKKVELMISASLGCKYNKKEILKAYSKFKRTIDINYLGAKMAKEVAKKLTQGKVIGWFEGRGEWGPRALGNRSVLADPRDIETKERINTHLKKRDWFMPFAPAIMQEYTFEYLKHGYGTPFMTLADDVKGLNKKKISAAIHIDGTARFQVVNKETNLPYWKVISEFRKLTGVPVILNTSFNKHGLPIVHTPEDALNHLVWGCLDELVIGEYLFTRKNE